MGQRVKRGLLQVTGDSDILYGQGSPFQTQSLLGADENLGIVGGGQSTDAPSAQLAQEKFNHTIKKGATLASLWKELKGAPQALKSFMAAFSGKHPKLRAGEVFSVTRRGDEVVEVRRDLGSGATLVISGAADAGYVPRIEQIAVHKRERQVSGVIYSSLVDAARGVDLPYSVVDDLVDLFGSLMCPRTIEIDLHTSFDIRYVL